VASGVLVRIPLPVMTVIVAGLALGVEVLGLVAGYGSWSLALLLIPGALAAAYLLEYRTLPYEPWHSASRAAPAPSVAPDDPEEFIDPVEEADRLDRTAPPGTPGSSAEVTSPPEPSGGSSDPE
jgi:hypothetical protein